MSHAVSVLDASGTANRARPSAAIPAGSPLGRALRQAGTGTSSPSGFNSYVPTGFNSYVPSGFNSYVPTGFNSYVG